ncbi:MAG: dehydrogenase, short-chain alcohol dehydrogenase like protein [Nevskia sp.]|nr:dehydrogenase, short-chain alcohol dehydrogenase like protein [Nevskia sp.]
MKRLENKVILVAGGGGIGSELARRYAGEGASVVLGDMDASSAGKVVKDIVAAGGKSIATQLDGSDQASVAAAVTLACDTFGGLDGLHANFACFADGRLNVGVLDLPLDVYDEMMQVNARGFLICTQKVLPSMIARGGGSIVYTSSGAAHVPGEVRVAYSMSKVAGHALMRHVATRYGRDGIRANVIAPGLIMHPSLAAVTGPEFEKHAISLTPIKSRLGRPDDIAALGALLMSDEGSYITGQVISVDGGATMRS